MITTTPAGYMPGFLKNRGFAKRPRGNGGGRNKQKYVDVVAAFDIETSTIDIDGEPHAFMYVWQFCIYPEWLIVGRTWEEFKTFLGTLNEEVSYMGADARLAVLVHNLSFEFQFLRGIHDFQNDEVFAVKPRKILKCSVAQIEFRCSYLHSNMNLDTYTKKFNAEHQKLSGAEFDYSKIRYPWTPLTDFELAYCVNDVLGLCEAFTNEMKADGDTIATVPLTSTGYVRRDVKRSMHTVAGTWLQTILPDYQIYTMLDKAFRGGDTHASRFYAERIVENVKSVDRSSSYPEVQCNHDFPMGEWHYMPAVNDTTMEFCIRTGKAFVVQMVMDGDIHLRNKYEACPYIPLSKCQNVSRETLDNGRVLRAEHLEIYVTDIDLGIILAQYDADSVTYGEIAYTHYGKLPAEFTDPIKEYYRRKTELKGVADKEILYMKSKNKLNSVYGMSAQKVVKQNILYNGGEFVEDTENPEELLLKANKKAFSSFAWGVWTTAWARWELHRAIDMVTAQTPNAWFIYADTDSVKYIGEVDFSEYNAEKERLSKANGACACDPGGEWHYMGVLEDDGNYSRFSTLGAKKYAYEDGKGLHVTIAGVHKTKGAAELAKGDQYGKGLERFINLKHPFTFRDAGGTAAVYNDTDDITITIDGHPLHITPNVAIVPSEYTLGVTAEYQQLIDYGRLLLDFYSAN